MAIFRGILGLLILVGLAYLLSHNRKNINWKLVGAGVGLQLIMALLLLKFSFVREFFQLIVKFFVIMIESMSESAIFIFGDLAKPSEPYGFAFVALPTILFFAALSAVLYYYGILQRVVRGFAKMMDKTMKLSGPESLAMAANVFIGQTEAPIVVRPYIKDMSRSELMCLMTGGMATIAGSVFGVYMSMLGGDSASEQTTYGMHLLTASLISAPAAIVFSKILIPEAKNHVGTHIDDVKIDQGEVGTNVLQSITNGTSDGVRLAVNVAAMLLTFMAFVFLFNKIFFLIGDWTNLNESMAQWSGGIFESLSIQSILGYLFSPLAWVIGIDNSDLLQVGRLLGEKTALNEFYAYVSLAQLKAEQLLSPRSIIISTYALCGFANFASIGIQIGGIGALAPSRTKDLSELGMPALIAGTLACLATATIAGMLV